MVGAVGRGGIDRRDAGVRSQNGQPPGGGAAGRWGRASSGRRTATYPRSLDSFCRKERKELKDKEWSELESIREPAVRASDPVIVNHFL